MLVDNSKPKRSISAFFFSYSAYIGVFSPYLGLWLNFRGFSPSEIGILMSPMQWSRVIAPPFWGWLADISGDPYLAKKLIGLSACCAVFSSTLLFFNWSLLSLFIIFCLVSFFLSGHIPIVESLAMNASKGNLGVYGKIRLWGSIGFIFAVLVGGFIFDFFGIKFIPHALFLSLILLIVFSVFLPQKKLQKKNENFLSPQKKLFTPKTANFLLASLFMLVAHAPLYTLFSLWLENNGYSRIEIGVIWTLGVLSEICFFYFQSSFFKKFDVKKVWVLCFFVASLRFFMILFSNGNLLVILFSQLLHAFTFGAHHSASMSIINEWFPSDAQSRGQSLYTMMSYGIGGSVGGIMAGWIWENFSPQASFLMAVLAALIGSFFAIKALKS